jgi:hypothetical protein
MVSPLSSMGRDVSFGKRESYKKIKTEELFMGQGICGVVQLEFKIEDYKIEKYKKYYPSNYFDFYKRKTKEPNLYTIKPDMFLPYYADLLIEFYKNIGENLSKETGLTPKSELLNITDFKQFKEAFSHSTRNGRKPMVTNYASVVGFGTRSAWLFYSGSYKAYFEEYTTLIHFERILVKLTKNPLASIVQLGIMG